MKDQIETIRTEAEAELRQADSLAALEALRVKYLGKKSVFMSLLKQMGSLTPEERPVIGQLANEARSQIERQLEACKSELDARALEARLHAEALDVTIDRPRLRYGHMHPLNKVLAEIEEVFIGFGFEIAEGPEIELEYYNFTALNVPDSHPSRDMQDTFYFSPEILLRSQTSPVQVRVMEQAKPPIRIISPGRVYRRDDIDATHSPLFHQVEGLVVDRGVTMASLKGTLETIVQALYGSESKVRFRPHHFPFTEPSAELDIMCFTCGGEGCRTCKGEGWIELLGCGMVHPNVLRGCGIDPDEYSGFAFGMGLDRLTMRRYGIDDLRLLFENDMRFLAQF